MTVIHATVAKNVCDCWNGLVCEPYTCHLNCTVLDHPLCSNPLADNKTNNAVMMDILPSTKPQLELPNTNFIQLNLQTSATVQCSVVFLCFLHYSAASQHPL